MTPPYIFGLGSQNRVHETHYLPASLCYADWRGREPYHTKCSCKAFTVVISKEGWAPPQGGVLPLTEVLLAEQPPPCKVGTHRLFKLRMASFFCEDTDLGLEGPFSMMQPNITRIDHYQSHQILPFNNLQLSRLPQFPNKPPPLWLQAYWFSGHF